MYQFTSRCIAADQLICIATDEILFVSRTIIKLQVLYHDAGEPGMATEKQ